MTIKPYDEMTLGEIKEELVEHFKERLNGDPEIVTQPDAIDDFLPMLKVGAAIVDIQHTLHHLRFGDTPFNPNGTNEEEEDERPTI